LVSMLCKKCEAMNMCVLACSDLRKIRSARSSMSNHCSFIWSPSYAEDENLYIQLGATIHMYKNKTYNNPIPTNRVRKARTTAGENVCECMHCAIKRMAETERAKIYEKTKAAGMKLQ